MTKTDLKKLKVKLKVRTLLIINHSFSIFQVIISQFFNFDIFKIYLGIQWRKGTISKIPKSEGMLFLVRHLEENGKTSFKKGIIIKIIIFLSVPYNPSDNKQFAVFEIYYDSLYIHFMIRSTQKR